MRTSPGNRNPNPWTDSTVTIPSATATAGSVIRNAPTVRPTQASEPTVATANGTCQRRSSQASSRHPTSRRIGTRFTAVNSASHGPAWGKTPTRWARVIPDAIVTSASDGSRKDSFGVNRSNTDALSSSSRPPRTGPRTAPRNRSIPVQRTPAITWT